MRLHLNKSGIRALGVAESFTGRDRYSTLAGVVMRGDFIVDGIGLGKTSVGGDDATEAIIALCRKLRRNDVNVVLVSGCVLSLYNIVDPGLLSRKSGTPVLCLTYKESSGIEDSIRRRFPDSAESKLKRYHVLGRRTGVRLKSGGSLYIRSVGMTKDEARSVLDKFTIQGSVPEPVKVARLVARAASRRSSRRG